MARDEETSGSREWRNVQSPLLSLLRPPLSVALACLYRTLPRMPTVPKENQIMQKPRLPVQQLVILCMPFPDRHETLDLDDADPLTQQSVDSQSPVGPASSLLLIADISSKRI